MAIGLHSARDDPDQGRGPELSRRDADPTGSLSAPPASAARHPFDDVGQLRQLRQLVARRARRAGLPESRADDLALAISELATNSIEHGGGRGLLTVWEVGNEVICQISDAGQFQRGTPSRAAPAPSARRGRGLWMVDAVCDLVERHASVHGQITRVHIWGPDHHPVHDQQ